MSQPNIKQLKAENLSAKELRLQKTQQAINDLYRAANSDETLKERLEEATSPENLVEIAARQGYELTVADIEMLRRRTQEQAKLHSDEFDDDELSEQELELVAGGLSPVAYIDMPVPDIEMPGVPSSPAPNYWLTLDCTPGRTPRRPISW
jgi:predicted ribosomally synthesized peptide with nif11-like leader